MALYIGNNVDKVINISEPASMCHMGESTFRRKFSRRVGILPLKYINYHKIEKAKELLANADFNILNLPETLGFYDLSHFYKVFKNITGLTTSRFREEMKIKALRSERTHIRMFRCWFRFFRS